MFHCFIVVGGVVVGVVVVVALAVAITVSLMFSTLFKYALWSSAIYLNTLFFCVCV